MIAKLIDKAQSLVTGINLQTVGYVVGASALCLTLGYCAGQSNASEKAALKVTAAAERVKVAAAKGEKAAALVNLSLTTKTQAQAAELREIVKDVATTDDAGAGTDAVMQRVRERAAR